MKKVIFRFKFFGMPVNGSRQAQIIAIVLVILCTGLAIMLSTLTPLDSLIAGILAMLLYALSYLLHHYGRFTADKLRGKKTRKVHLHLLPEPNAHQTDKISLLAQLHPRHIDGGILMTTLLLVIVCLLWFFTGKYSPMTGFLLAWGIFVQITILVATILIYIFSSITAGK